MKKYVLDKIISVNTDYRAEEDKAYIITEIGTSSTSKATFYVAGSPVAEFINDFAPNFKINTNLAGPFKLGPTFIVVPQDKLFKFTGASGSTCRIKGTIIELEPGEALPGDYMSRYAEQPRKFITYDSGSETKSEGETISDKEEITIIDHDVPAGEKHLFNSYLMAAALQDTTLLSADDWSVRIYIDDRPYDIMDWDMGPLGITHYATPYPPTATTNHHVFSLVEFPFELEPGKNLKIKLVNTSGSDYTVPTGTTWTGKALIVYVKEYL